MFSKDGHICRDRGWVSIYPLPVNQDLLEFVPIFQYSKHTDPSDEDSTLIA